MRRALPADNDVSSGLHGRRRGKSLRAHQRDLINNLLPSLSLDPSAPIDLAELFGRQPREVWLEVGFGSGEHLVATSMQDPDIAFIGCEPFLNGMARALSDIVSRDLKNIRLYCGDAYDVIAALPNDCLERVLVFYPDPWPKRRQRKRRFISDLMLARLARVVRPGGQLRFVTDIDSYCGWALARLGRSPYFEWQAERSIDWQVPWQGWVQTRYETKARTQGRRPCYVIAQRTRSRPQTA